jgi:hypothetical protein
MKPPPAACAAASFRRGHRAAQDNTVGETLDHDGEDHNHVYCAHDPGTRRTAFARRHQFVRGHAETKKMRGAEQLCRSIDGRTGGSGRTPAWRMKAAVNWAAVKKPLADYSLTPTIEHTAGPPHHPRPPAAPAAPQRAPARIPPPGHAAVLELSRSPPPARSW